MKTAEVLSYLRSLDVKLWLDGDRLHYSAPPGVLTPTLLKELAEHKQEICTFLCKAQWAVVDTGASVLPLSRNGNLPLSFAQQRMWFIDQLAPANPAYHIDTAIRLAGALNIAALSQTFSEIVRRHEVLRTTFAIVDGQPSQVVGPAFDRPLPIVDLQGSGKTEQEPYTHLLASQHAGRPFDLSRGPLLRTTLLRINEQEHLILLAMHHIISDGWSLGLLIHEVAALYEAFSQGRPSPLPELAVQYADFARWQREWLKGERLEGQLNYWKRQLNDAPILTIPTDRARPPVQSFQGASRSRMLSESLSISLKELSRQAGATLFMTLLAGFHALLHRYAQQATILTGTPVANRTRAETEPVIGFFVNTLVLRSDFADDPTFLALLGRLRQHALAAYGHQDVPFELLVERLRLARDPSYNPLFQVMFSWEEAAWSRLAVDGLRVSPLALANRTAQFDLTLSVGEAEGGRQRCTMQYNTALFDEPTIARLLSYYEQLLDGVAAAPQQRVSRLPLLSTAERQQVLGQWNQTAVEYEPAATVGELFERQVRRNGAAVALVAGAQAVTYAELNGRANQLGRYLRMRGVGAEVRVGLLLERGLEMVVSLLGVVKAGGTYVPLDPSYPEDRLEYMVQDSSVQIVLTERRLAAQVAGSGVNVVCLDERWTEIAQQEAGDVASEVVAENIVNLMYTSGSSGRPKGVMNTHRGICNRLLWGQDAFQLGVNDRVLQKTPSSFDVSVWEFFWPLLTGARLVMARPGGHQDAAYLRSIIEQEQITIVHFVPSMLQIFLEEPGLERCSSLRKVLCSGEALPFELQERFFARLNAELHNLYGPTETAIEVTHWTCERGGERAVVPIGSPIANTQIYLLDQHQQPVPIGVVGELHIGGVSLARGYYRQPGLTAEKFIPDAFSREPGARLYKSGDLARYMPDGAIEFLGRIDHQVKLRGFRIELGEIEAVLSQHEDVREVVVVDREVMKGERQLVAYVVVQSERPPTVSQLRDHIRIKLPEHMVPAAFVFMAEMPTSPSGKIDRLALPAPEHKRPEMREAYSVPITEIEQTIASVWQEVLELEQVSVHDNFFDLGGHSLLLVQAQRKLASTLKREIQLVDLFKYPTINSLSRYLGQDGHKPVISQHGAQMKKLEQGKDRLRQLKLRRQASKLSTQ